MVHYSAPKISVSVDDDTSTESYLARPVLLHGGLPPKPWVVFNDLKLKFSSTIEQVIVHNICILSLSFALSKQH